MTPRITVATAVYNGASSIEATLHSVASQTYRNIEYIVVDGGSLDETIQKVQRYSKYIAHIVSENDLGVYDAMNKAIDLATGDWIIFMNSGDYFSSTSVVEDIFSKNKYPETSIIYGGHNVLYRTGRVRVVPARSSLSFWKGSQFSHQSAFIPLLYHKSFRYDLTYKIAADYVFFLLALKHGITYTAVNVQISTITAHGLSDTQRIKSIQERSRALKNLFLSVFYFPFLIANAFLRHTIKTALSKV